MCVCGLVSCLLCADTHKCPLTNPKPSVGGVQSFGRCPEDTISWCPVDTRGHLWVSRGHCQWVSRGHFRSVWCPLDTVSRVGGGDTVRLVACKPASENHTSAPPPITPPCLTCTLLISVWVGDMHFDCGRGLVKLNESIGQD